MRLTETMPPYCASCYRQEGETRYVDFDAAYDGPVIPGSPVNIPVDDLVICENCLKEAFALLDLHGMRAEAELLSERIKVLEDDNEKKDRMIANQFSTIGHLVQHPIKRPSGLPAIVGLSEEEKKKINAARGAGGAGKTRKKRAKETV